MRLTEQEVGYRDGDVGLMGFLVSADDRGDGRRPGVLVIHGGAGLDEHAREQAKRFARLGAVVFACDMYGGEITGSRDRVMAQIGEFRADRAQTCRRARAGIEILTSDVRVGGRIAVVGYCFGGLVALELARSGAELAGIVTVHGSLQTTRPAQAEAIRCPVLVCHGALDPHVPTAHLTAFIDEMSVARADWQLVVYGGAVHGFTHRDGPTGPGVEYHERSDSRSFRAITAFLAEVFAPYANASLGPFAEAPARP